MRLSKKKIEKENEKNKEKKKKIKEKKTSNEQNRRGLFVVDEMCCG